MTFYRRIYFDTNIFVGAFEEQSEIGSRLRSLIVSHSRQAPPRFLTSELAFSELLVRPYREADPELAEFYRDLSLGNYWLGVEPVSFPILDTASFLRAQRKSLKLPDAIHLATAMFCNCSHFLTGDHGIIDQPQERHPFRNEILPPLAVIRPDLPTLSSILQDLAA